MTTIAIPGLTDDELRGLAERGAAAIAIVFDGPPGPESGRFIEVEDARARLGISVGHWIDRGDGTWALEIARAYESEAAAAMARELLARREAEASDSIALLEVALREAAEIGVAGLEIELSPMRVMLFDEVGGCLAHEIGRDLKTMLLGALDQVNARTQAQLDGAGLLQSRGGR